MARSGSHFSITIERKRIPIGSALFLPPGLESLEDPYTGGGVDPDSPIIMDPQFWLTTMTVPQFICSKQGEIYQKLSKIQSDLLLFI